MAKKQKSKSKSKSRKSAASKADKHLLYEQAVQETEADILLAEDIFKERYGGVHTFFARTSAEPASSPATVLPGTHRTEPFVLTLTPSR